MPGKPRKEEGHGATVDDLDHVGKERSDEGTIPFHLARGAKRAGIEVRMVLAGDSTDLIRFGVAQTVHGQGVPPLSEVLDLARDHDIRIHV